MTIRDKVAAYKAAVGDFVPADELRLPLTDADALALAKEVGSTRFGAEVAAAVEAIEALPPKPEEDAALADWAIARKAAWADFWNYFESEAVDGVAIIRRR